MNSAKIEQKINFGLTKIKKPERKLNIVISLNIIEDEPVKLSPVHTGSNGHHQQRKYDTPVTDNSAQNIYRVPDHHQEGK